MKHDSAMNERIVRIYHPFRAASLLVLFAVILAMSACQTDSGLHEGTLAVLSTRSAELGTEVASQATIISHLATRGPARVTQPVGTIQPTPYQPVQGSVEIEGGACCVGGKAGDRLDIETGFEATSPLGEVTQMRVRFGSRTFVQEQLADAEWEPFVSAKSFPIEIFINWIGQYVGVQYMDDGGNLSPVYYDDISVEGHP